MYIKNMILRPVLYITFIAIAFPVLFIITRNTMILQIKKENSKTDNNGYLQEKIFAEVDMKNDNEFGQQINTELQLELETLRKERLAPKDEITPSNSSIYSLSPLELMKVPKIDFIKGLKNPCFYVKNPPQNDGGPWVADDVVMKCWPYYQLVGVEKCGTSDLYERLTAHHYILIQRLASGRKRKEPLWYNGVYGQDIHNNTIGGYLALVDNATHTIHNLCPDKVNKKSPSGKESCPYIIGDFSARTMNHNDKWILEEENQNMTIPKILVSDKIHHINPDTKIIIMLRNPITRLLSDYKFYDRNGQLGFESSQNDFHTRVVEAIKIWEMCVSEFRFHEDACTNGKRWARWRHVKIGGFWQHDSLDRLAVSIYSIYIKHWLRIFPRENILIIKMEEYSRKPLEYLEKHVLPFLGLEPFKSETRSHLLRLEERNVQYNKFMQSDMQMWNKTWELLDDFYAPYNRQLVDMLGDEKFLWK